MYYPNKNAIVDGEFDALHKIGNCNQYNEGSASWRAYEEAYKKNLNKVPETLMVFKDYSTYTSDDGTMITRKSGNWVYLNQSGIEIDKDTYRNDLAERNNLRLIGG